MRAIARMMAEGRWRAKSHAEYAEAHGIVPSTVRGYSAEASRQLVALSSEDERHELLASTVGKLDAIEEAAREDGDLKAAVSALTLQSAILGLTQTKPTTAVQVNVSTTVAPPGVPDEVAAAWHGDSVADRRVMVRHLLLEAMREVLEWPASERDEALAEVRGMMGAEVREQG